jgi:hypothetical protein
MRGEDDSQPAGTGISSGHEAESKQHLDHALSPFVISFENRIFPRFHPLYFILLQSSSFISLLHPNYYYWAHMGFLSPPSSPLPAPFSLPPALTSLAPPPPSLTSLRLPPPARHPPSPFLAVTVTTKVARASSGRNRARTNVRGVDPRWPASTCREG